MLYSFDIDGTLFKNDVNKKNNHLSSIVSWNLTRALLRGDVLLINTANNVFTKTKQVVYDILKPAFNKESNGSQLLSKEEKKQLIDNFNKNFYVSLSDGAFLSKMAVNDLKALEDATKDEEYFKENCININKVMYKENLSESTLNQLKDLFKKDKVLSKRLDDSKWAYLEMEKSKTFAEGQKIYDFNQKLPESIKVVFYTKVFDVLDSKQEKTEGKLTKEELNSFMKQEYEYVGNLLDKSGIDANVTVLWNGFMLLGKKSINKTTPIKYLSKLLGFKKKDCVMFGNEKVDIVDKKYASTIIVESKDNNTKNMTGFNLADNMEEAFVQGEFMGVMDDENGECLKR